MPPIRTLRRLLSRARQDWQEVVEGLFAAPAKPPGPRPLRVMRLERRRVLSADFSLTASSLVLDGFDQGGDTLAITQQDDAYLFTTADGWNASDDGALPLGVSVLGETLSIQRGLFDGLSDGLTVVGSGQSALNVTLGEADFSGAAGPLSIVSPTSLGQQPLSLFTAPSDGIRLGVAPSGLTVSSLNIAGDLEVTSFGKITDAEGTQIIVTGDATFTSIAGSPDGDFNGDGTADLVDRSHWTANYGLGQDASKYDGDANGDDIVNAVDYALWRDSEGQTVSGGIQLADSPGDRLEVGGTVTFDAAADGRHEISIGVAEDDGRNGWVELGVINAFGSNVTIIEDAPSDVADVEAYDFTLTSSGKINVLPEAIVLVENAASLTSLYVDYQADFDGDGLVDEDDYSAWLAAYGTASDAMRTDGDANGDEIVNALDYAIWRDGLQAFDRDADIEGGITVSDGAQFKVGGLVTLSASDSLTPPGDEAPSVDRFDITVNDGATAVFGSLVLDGRNVKVVEDAGAFKESRDGNQDGTVIAGINAEQLLLVSYGPITSTGTAEIFVGGGDELLPNATFASTSSILLADADGRDVQIDGEATFVAGADGTDTGASIRVGVDSSGEDSTAFFAADDGLRFSAPGEVRIAEDSATQLLGWSTYVVDECVPVDAVLAGNVAASLELQSDGRITDAEDAITSVGEDASFRVNAGSLSGDAPAIELADRSVPAMNSLSVGGYATFVDGSDTGIQVGTDGDGDPGSQTFDAGMLRFSAGNNAVVIINEGSDSELGNWSNGPIDFFAGSQPDRSTAGTLELLSRGSLTDETGAIVVVANDATFVAYGGDGGSTTKAIELADDNTTDSTDLLDIGGTATFVDAGAAGSAAAGIDVGVAVDGSPAEAAFVADGIRFSSPNASVRIAEDSSTVLESGATADASVLSSVGALMESVAAELEVWSAGFITDDADAVVRVTGDATLIANAANTDGDTIRLADGLAPNTFVVDGLATFIAGQDDDANTVVGGIAVGVTSDGAAAPATFDAGSLRFFAQGSEARIAEQSSTLLAGWAGADLAALSADVTPAASEALLIEVFSAGSITDADEAQILARGADETTPAPDATASFVATTDIVLADEDADNRLVVDGLATFIAGDGSRIDVGVVSDEPAGTDDGVAALAEFNAGQVRFSAPDGTVRVAEDSATDLAGWTGATIGVIGTEAPPESSSAATFELFAEGAITDGADARIDISSDATLVVSDTAVFEVTDEAAIRLADSDTASNAFSATGTTTLLVLPIAGAALGIDVGITSDGEASDATFNTGSVRFAATGRDVRVAEDSDTVLASWTTDASIASLGSATPPEASTAANLQLLTIGTLTDAADAVVNVASDATLVALGSGEAIRLADGATDNAFTVGGTATLISGPTDSAAMAAGSILVGVTAAAGPAADATFDAGQLRFYAEGATVLIAEDSSTVLTNWEADTLPPLLPGPAPTRSLAQTLELSSAGSISDMQLATDDTHDVVVAITGLGDVTDPMANATFVAVEDILLADGGAGNEIVVDGITTLVAGANRSIDVGVMSLGDVAGDGAPADATFDTGTLRFSSVGGTVRIAEDSSTVLTNWEADTISALIGATLVESNAQTLGLLSAGTVTDAKNKPDDTSEAAVRISASAGEEANATFVAATSITLADAPSADNVLSVGDLVTFIAGAGESIDVGVDTNGDAAVAVFNAGSLRFSVPDGTVRIAEDSGTELAGWTDAEIDVLGSTPEPSSSSATRFELRSDGPITDADDAVIEIGGNARFVVAETAEIVDATEGAIVQAIVLADNNDESTPNDLTVGGFAEFLVEVPVTSGFEGPKGIDVGVQANGMPANANFMAHSLRFWAPDALVRIAEDDDTQIGASSSQAARIQLKADGDITDELGAETEITVFAELNAMNGEANIVLGDNSYFSMGTPALFDETTYLAMDALSLSVEVDSAVNLRTAFDSSPAEGEYGLADSNFDGTYFLTATGDISQVGSGERSESLTADKVSLASYGAIFMTGLVLTNSSEDEANLQIKAGTSRELSTDLSVAGGTIGGRFADRDIPTSTNSALAPILVEIDDETTGLRGPTVQDRDPERESETEENDVGFEDLLVEIEETGLTEGSEDDPAFRNARVSETLSDGSSAEHDLPKADGTEGVRQISDAYSAVVIVKGDAVVGDVNDVVGTVREDNDLMDGARGFEVSSSGNAYLHVVGDLTFTSVNREVDSTALTPPATGVVVEMGGGVFTAVADHDLTIDTDDASQASTDGQTSLLRSVTGTVSSVGRSAEEVNSFEPGDEDYLYGPRLLLDPSSEQPNAATTGLVRADTGFEQLITMAVGSRGENNVLVEVEWADVTEIRQDSAAKFLDVGERVVERGDYDPSLPGSTEFADLTQTPFEEIQKLDISGSDLVYQELDADTTAFRVATLSHQFDSRFVPSNPAQETLPTTVRVYNDPSINLFDNAAELVGEEGSEAEAGPRDLNSASFTLAPRIIAVEGGFFLPIESTPPQQIVAREVTVFANETLTAEQPTSKDGGRAVVASNAERLEYGRIEDGKWVDDLPGEAWPQIQDEIEGDYLREVRDLIDNGAYSEGTYRIQIATPRGEQVLEEWVKGDLGEEGGVSEDEGLPDGPAEEAELLDAPAPWGSPEELPAAALIEPLSSIRVDSLDESHSATNAAFAAMAAVGGWRRRLGGTGAFRLDDDGVAFTRAKRRRRNRPD